MFEAFGFNYFGPLNGHNIHKLVKMLKLIKELKGPVLLHVMTEKGKGYAPAENDYRKLHAIGKIDKETGKSIVKASDTNHAQYYYKIFGKSLTEICRNDKRVVGVTAAMLDGTGLDILFDEMPDRVIDVGIAEGHAVTFASGMATQGMIPVIAIYSTFLQRAYDHVIHDCAQQKLHCVFVLDRAGLVGEDGPTHHGVMDISYLRAIPNMTVTAPKDENELRDLLYSAINSYTSGPTSIRFPRGRATGVEQKDFSIIPFATWERLKDGKDIAILSVGKLVDESMKACEKLATEGISAEVINARFIKPMDESMLTDILRRFQKIITVEEGQIIGGFGSGVLEYASANNFKNDIHILGLPDMYVEHGSQAELLHDLKLDADGISDYIIDVLSTNYIEDSRKVTVE